MKNKKKNPMGMWWPRMREKIVPSKKKYNDKDRKENKIDLDDDIVIEQVDMDKLEKDDPEVYESVMRGLKDIEEGRVVNAKIIDKDGELSIEYED